MGVPSTYTPEIGEAICQAIASSEEGLRKMVERRADLPGYETVTTWLANNVEFKLLYAHAKQQQLHGFAEQIIDISRDETLDPNDKRIRIDTLKWLLSRLIPRTYGDKLDVTSDGQQLSVPAHQVDARIQSIIMMAQARRAGQASEPDVVLDANALKLLD